MKIVYFSDSFLPIVDGVGNVVYQYAYNMANMNNEVYVVAPQADTGYRGSMPFEIIDYVGVKAPVMKSYKVGTPVLDAHCINRLRMIKPDIVHVHSPFTAGQAGLVYAKRNKVPVIGTFHSKYHDDFYEVSKSEIVAEVGSKAVKEFFNQCNEVWTVSNGSAEELHSYGYKKDIVIIENGTDPRPLADEAAKRVSKQYALGSSLVLLYVGQINRKKNIKTIIEAFSMIEGDVKLVLAGQGPHLKEMQEYAKKCKVADRTVFTGYIGDREDMMGLYRRAELFVFPSLYDTSGLVVREAATQETPSVVVRGSAAAECIKDWLNGFLCDNDPDSLANVIIEALSDTDRLKTIGKKAKDTIPIPWNVIMEQVMDRYTEVING